MSISAAQFRRFLVLGLAAVPVMAGLFCLSTREPMLEGRRVRDLLKESQYDSREATSLFRRNGSNSVPGLVQIFSSRPSLGGRFAGELKKHYWFYGRLPRPISTWVSEWVDQTEQKSTAREHDREWAVVWCASLNQDAASAHRALLRACRDPNPHVRAEAVKALLRTEVPPALAVPKLSSVLSCDSSAEVKGWAAFYLGLLHEQAEPALPALRQLTNSPHWLLGPRAREALEKIEFAVAQEHSKEEPR
jgi:hypothetical protein